MNHPLPREAIDWLQGECLGANCPPQHLYRVGMQLEQQTAAMSPEQQLRQREIQAVFRRKYLRTMHYERR